MILSADKGRDENIRMLLTCNQFPLQFEGDVDGDEFYFRARHGEWKFSVASNPADDAVSVGLGMAEGFLVEGEYDDTEYIEAEAGRDLIRDCAEKYRAWKTRAG